MSGCDGFRRPVAKTRAYSVERRSSEAPTGSDLTGSILPISTCGVVDPLRDFGMPGHVAVRGIGGAGRLGRMQRAGARDHPAPSASGRPGGGSRNRRSPCPTTEPRKLRSSFLSRLKQGSNGSPLIEAQIDWPADLERIAGQAHVARWPGPRELHRARRPAVLEHAAGTAGAVETGEGENLAGDESAGLIGGHGSRQGRSGHRDGQNGSQHITHNHVKLRPTERG